MYKEHSASYIPFGTYHILFQGQLRSVDSQCQPELLVYNLGEFVQHIWASLTAKTQLFSHPLEEYRRQLVQCYQHFKVPDELDGIQLEGCCVGLTSKAARDGEPLLPTCRASCLPFPMDEVHLLNLLGIAAAWPCICWQKQMQLQGGLQGSGVLHTVQP